MTVHAPPRSVRGGSDATWCETRRRGASDHSLGMAACLGGVADMQYKALHSPVPLRNDTRPHEKRCCEGFIRFARARHSDFARSTCDSPSR